VKKILLAVAVAAAVVFPTSAFAGTFTGVVVGNSGGNLAVASKSGVVRTVHTRAHVRLGTRVRVNGAAVRASGVAHRARVHGVVVGRSHGVTFLAAGRSLLAVRAHSGRRLASTASGPAAGAVVNSTVAIGNGQLTQQSMQVVGSSGSVTIQAPVTAVGAGTISVTINGQSLTIPLPAGIQLPASLVGQSVTLNVTLSVSGATAQAENDEQGDDNDDQGQNDDDQGGDDGGGGDD
jgi:hypothetical protein